MAAESSKEPGQDHVESLIDDLIRDILNEAGGFSKSAGGGRMPTATLIETAIASPRAGSRTSMLERLLLAEAFASALANAIAPALADALAPRVMKVLEESMSGDMPGKGSQTGSSERGRKQETK
jgi:hypothetical protein